MSGIRTMHKKNIVLFVLMLCHQMVFAMSADPISNLDQSTMMAEQSSSAVVPQSPQPPASDVEASSNNQDQTFSRVEIPTMEATPAPQSYSAGPQPSGPYYVTKDTLHDKNDDEGLSDAEIAALVAGLVGGAAVLGLGLYGAKQWYDTSKAPATDGSDAIKKAKTPEDFARIQSALETTTKNLQAEKESILAGKDLGRTAAETQQRLAAIDVQLKKIETTNQQVETTKQQVQTSTTTMKPIQTNTPGNATPELDDKLRRVNNALSIYGVSSHQNLMDDKGNITLPKDMADADKIRPLLEQRYQITQERSAILAGEKPANASISEADKPATTPEQTTEETKSTATAEAKPVDAASKKTYLQRFAEWRQSLGGTPKTSTSTTPAVSEPVKTAGGARTDALKTYLTGAKTPEDFKQIQSRLQDGEKDLSQSINDLAKKRAVLVDEQQTKGDSPELRSRLAEVDQTLKDNNNRLAEVRSQIRDVSQVVSAQEQAALARDDATQSKDALTLQKKIASYKPLQTAPQVPGSDAKPVATAAETRQQLKDSVAASKQRSIDAQKRALDAQKKAVDAQKKLKSQYGVTPEKSPRPTLPRPSFMR